MKRALWIVNHKTLIAAEIPILRDLGYEVFIPKIIPQVPDYRSAVVDYAYDRYLQLPTAALNVLNDHPMYWREWSPTVTEILNENFEVLITSVSAYTTPLFEALRKFDGVILARVFGREFPRRYTEFFDLPKAKGMMKSLEIVGERFVFGQGFDNLADIEAEPIKARAHTLVVAVPDWVWSRASTWKGGDPHALFLCPNIMDSGHYREIYDDFKRDYGAIPHRIFGRQNIDPNDPSVLPYMSDHELLALYARADLFLYPSKQPRHVHYSPIEAMIVGTPVLFMKGGMLDFLGGDEQPGRCGDPKEMTDKAQRILRGDARLSAAIRERQSAIVDTFSSDLARRQWAAILPGAGAKVLARASS